MHRIALALVSSLVVLLASTAPAGAITNGQPDGFNHPYVGMTYVFLDENYVEFCSGTLISPTVFLTAGHCTSDFASIGSQVYVTFQPEADFDPANAVTGTPYTHPSFCIGCAPGLPGFDAYDVGVIVLDAPVENVGLGSLPYAGQVNDMAKGSLLTAVGYGVRDFAHGGGQPTPVGYADRYFATVKLINVNNVIGDMFLKHSGNPGQGKGGTCFGDSGGPIFADDQVTVLAVTSFGTNGNCAGNGYAQRIDRPDVLSWIEGYL